MTNKLPMTYNEEIRRMRKLSNRTSKDVANHLGVSPAWVSKMEKGNIRLTKETYEKIRHFIGYECAESTTIKKMSDEVYLVAFSDGFEQGKRYGYNKAREELFTLVVKALKEQKTEVVE